MITETDDISMPFAFVYNDEEWSAVVATFPDPLADGAEINAEREGLEFVATSYLNLSHHHRLRSAKGFPTKGWQQKRKQIADTLASAENAGTVASVLSDLREDLRHADAAVEGFGMLGRGHQGKRDAAREWPYLAALAMWKRLGGRPAGVSRRSNATAATREAGGPAIRFLIAALTPIMADNMPGPEALAKFVKKTRKAEKAREAKKPMRKAARSA
jgi:hypothetical protein